MRLVGELSCSLNGWNMVFQGGNIRIDKIWGGVEGDDLVLTAW